MKLLITSLSKKQQADIERIRLGVGAYCARSRKPGEDDPSAVISGAEQMLHHLEVWLLDEEQKQLLQLTPWDVFFLNACAYLCDIGHIDSGNTSDTAIGAGATKQGSSQRVILSHWKALGIGSAAMAAAIADICDTVSGSSEVLQGPLIDRAVVVDGTTINTPLVSAAIWMARSLNLSALDTAGQVCRLLAASQQPTPEAYNQSFTVAAVGPHPYLSSTIQVKLQCRDAELHRALKHHERAVQERLQHFNQSICPRFLYSDVIYEIEADGYTPLDLRFSVDTSAALKLLTGNRLYSDNRVFLRELIQNAVDACNLRKRFEPDYSPSISIRFNDDISKVTVRDNGIGMDRQWIEKYFLTIGISLYQSAEVRSASQRTRIDFSFISQFGIGFLSSFLVAEKITLQTSKAGAGGLMISISNLRDYFDVRALKTDVEQGTQVTLHLKRSKINYCRSLEYTGYLKTTIRFLDIPVDLHGQNGQITTIGRETLSYEKASSADIDFIAPLEFKNSEGYVLLRAKKNVDHIFAVETAKGGVSVFQDGIFVTQVDTLLPEGARQHVIGRINLKGEDKCALSMDRNRIFWSDHQLKGIKHTIRMGLAQAANLFMASVDAQDVSTHTRQSIINQLSIFFDFNEVDDALHERLCEPIRAVVHQRFRNFVRLHFAHTLRAEGIPEADGYGQQWQQRILESFRKP